MNNNEAKKYIDGRMLELAREAELPISAKKRKRIDEEAAFLCYVRSLYEIQEDEE